MRDDYRWHIVSFRYIDHLQPLISLFLPSLMLIHHDSSCNYGLAETVGCLQDEMSVSFGRQKFQLNERKMELLV